MTDKPQHMKALDRANYVRRNRAAMKRTINAGDVLIADLIAPGAKIPEHAMTMSMYELLSAQRRRGGRRTSKFLRRVEIAPTRRVGELTARQRRVLAIALAPQPS